ncbi:hypothetical protein M7I_3588 [Glarea lozoyensis 74030]|uniref:Uncharacterized protein n=1 Tax=Glarea lozoyensis (strain ATCC 74030 / MF5533) TaxID=1104152 RepID=H0ELW5_GLAL7|nr:hypothetical protein M7I_3588 [Glarea lozoyensis 74030]
MSTMSTIQSTDRNFFGHKLFILHSLPSLLSCTRYLSNQEKKA